LLVTELYEGIWSCRCVDLVTKLRVELLRKVFKEGIGQLLVEVAIAESKETSVLESMMENNFFIVTDVADR
jgi:hypothetical protein